MPIYEYQCDNCRQVIEAWQSLADEPLTACQSCTGSLKKLISMSSFHLKGGGWYADGYSGTSADKSCAKTESSPTTTCSTPCPPKSSSSEAIGTTESKPSGGQSACCDA